MLYLSLVLAEDGAVWSFLWFVQLCFCHTVVVLSVGEDFVKPRPSYQSGRFELKQSRAAFLFLGSNCSQLFAGLLSLI